MSEQSSHDAVDREREMQEHEREAARRDGAESGPDGPGGENAADDETKPAPPGSTPNVTGQP